MKIISVALLSSSVALAQTDLKTQWDVKSDADQYTIEVTSDSAGRIDGQDVALSALSKFIPILNRKFDDPCPKLPRKAPIEIVRTRGEERRAWKLYPRQKTFSDGEMCLTVSGDGLYEFPIHRQWLLGPTRWSIPLGDRFTIELNDGKLTFVAENGLWRNVDESFFTNWELAENFVAAASNFDLAYRTAKIPGADAERFALKVKDKRYQFVRLGDDWGIELESKRWLVVAPRFRVVRDISLAAWRSRIADELTALKKRDTLADRRHAIAKDLSSKWNSDIKHVYLEILLTKEEDEDLKLQIVKYLRYHPTDDIMKSLVAALAKNDNPDILQHITDALRVRNPKGPRIALTDDWLGIEKKIQQWQKWANEFQAVPQK